MSYNLRKGTAIVEVIVVVAIIGLVGGGSKIGDKYFDIFGRKARAAQKEAQKNLALSMEVQKRQAEELEALKVAGEAVIKLRLKDAELSQSASDSLATATSTFNLYPAANRKEKVIEGSVATTAAALPPPKNLQKIVEETQRLLDETRTSNAELINKFDLQKSEIEKLNYEVSAATKKVTELEERAKKAEGRVDTAEKKADAAAAETDKAKAGLTEFIGKWAHTVAALVGCVGLLLAGFGGWFAKPKILLAGLAGIAAAVVAILIPGLVYTIICGVVLLVGIVVVGIHTWGTEKDKERLGKAGADISAALYTYQKEIEARMPAVVDKLGTESAEAKIAVKQALMDAKERVGEWITAEDGVAEIHNKNLKTTNQT